MNLYHSIGNTLRSEREERELSIAEAAHLSKIRPHLLEALEEGIITIFPSSSHYRNFAQRYADYLTVDLSKELVQIKTTFILKTDDLISRSQCKIIPHPALGIC